jgi:hypothetical protein
MKNSSFNIGLLSVTATLLAVGIYFAPRQADALMTIKDRDFSMVTANSQQSDTLYVLDNRTGKVAVYSYDASRRVVAPKVAGDMADIFGN